MSDYDLVEDLYISPSPAGAYYAASSLANDALRHYLLSLMKDEISPALSPSSLARVSGFPEKLAVENLYQLQSRLFVQGLQTSRRVGTGDLDVVLPPLLSDIAGRDSSLLADEQGTCLSSHRFDHKSADMLSRLSAELGQLHQQHQSLTTNLSIQTYGWSITNPSGFGEVGFWPLYIGSRRFVLVQSGLPNLNQTATIDLIWALVWRYMKT